MLKIDSFGNVQISYDASGGRGVCSNRQMPSYEGGRRFGQIVI